MEWAGKPALFGALLIGLLAGSFAAFLCYLVVPAFATEMPFLWLVVGAAVGGGCRFGAGRPSVVVGLMACLISGALVTVGGFLMFMHLVKDQASEPLQLMEQALGFPYDCEFTAKEVQKVWEFNEHKGSWSRLSVGERARVRRDLRKDCKRQVKEWRDDPAAFEKETGLHAAGWEEFVHETLGKRPNLSALVLLGTFLLAFTAVRFGAA